MVAAHRHGRRTDRDLTRGSIVLNLWSLAWPSTVTGAIHTVDLLLEIVWAGFLGAASIAGIGAGQVWVGLFNTAGETGLPMMVSLVTIWLVQQPLARILSGSSFTFEVLGQAITLPSGTGIGPLGIAWAIVIALGVRLLVYFPYLWWGPWWRRAV